MFRVILPLLLLINFSSYAYTLISAERHSTITGYTRAVKSMSVTAETAGRLTQVNLGMGDISDGSVFAVIDPVFTKYALNSANISLKKLDTAISRIKNNIAYLQKEYNRVESLFLSEVETESRRDGAKQSLDQAEFSLAELEAEKKALMVSIAELTEKLKRQHIKVPAGWTVTTKPMEEGELIAVGSVIAKAGDYRKLTVPIFVDNAQAEYLSSKKVVDVTIGDKKYTAKVNRISPAFDETTRKRQAELLLDIAGLGGWLVEIPVVTKTDGLMVDKRAVNERYANARVKHEGREIPVSIIDREGDMIIIAPSKELSVGMELQAAE